MNLLPHVFSPLRSGIFLGLAAALVALAWLLWPEAAPIAPDFPATGLQSDVCSTRAVSRGIPPASEAQKDENGKPAEIGSVDEWISVSPRRARLMSPEAMAGYEPILAALDLSPGQLLRLKQLIVERAESASDADQLGKEHRLSPEQTLLLRNEAEAVFERELEAVAGTANFKVVREMLELAPQLAEIAHSVGRELVRTGTPLDAHQMLQLAHLYKVVYAGDPASRPVDRSAGFDAQIGLGKADQQVLAHAVAILSSAQVEVLRRTMASFDLLPDQLRRPSDRQSFLAGLPQPSAI